MDNLQFEALMNSKLTDEDLDLVQGLYTIAAHYSSVEDGANAENTVHCKLPRTIAPHPNPNHETPAKARHSSWSRLFTHQPRLYQPPSQQHGDYCCCLGVAHWGCELHNQAPPSRFAL